MMLKKRKAPSGNSKYIQMIESLLSYVLISYCESKGTDEVRIVTDWKKSIAYVFICAKVLFKDRIYLKDILKGKRFPEWSFQVSTYADGWAICTKIDRALNDMVKIKRLAGMKSTLAGEYDGTEYGKSHTLYNNRNILYIWNWKRPDS